MIDGWIRIASPTFIAGLEVEGGYVQATAPIVRYMLGWTPGRVQEYAYRRGWTVEWNDGRL